MRPLIGITTYVESARWGPWDAPAALVPLTYVRAVEAAGGCPLLIPPSDDDVPELVAALDGIVFSGGADIDPDSYGASRHPETVGTRPERDRFETALMEGGLSAGVPVLGVCRGMQLLNVVRGGDLIQHLPDAGNDRASHRRQAGVFARHEVTVDPDSNLYRILGDRALVASHHHQAPGALGRDLAVAATAPDGTVEALEDRGAPFAMGVLWHPEEGEDRALFEELVQRARSYSEEKS